MSKMLVLISALALSSLSESTIAQGGMCEARCSARCEKAQGIVGSVQGAISQPRELPINQSKKETSR